jgi:hypothetical protein
MKRIKTKIIVAALIMASAGSVLGMLTKTQKADAAILVYDQENIFQAVKTAINTADILTNEQKQLALQIIDMTSMSSDKLEGLLQSQSKSKQIILDESQGKTGALLPKTSAGTFWNNTFSNIEDVLSGNITVMDAYSANQKALKAMEKTNQDALHGAKVTQSLQTNIAGTVNDALAASANASGTKEAVQANTQTVAAGTMGTLYGNNLMSEVLAVQVMKYQKEAQDEANAMALREQTVTQIQNDVAGMRAAVGGLK